MSQDVNSLSGIGYKFCLTALNKSTKNDILDSQYVKSHNFTQNQKDDLSVKRQTCKVTPGPEKDTGP